MGLKKKLYLNAANLGRIRMQSDTYEHTLCRSWSILPVKYQQSPCPNMYWCVRVVSKPHLVLLLKVSVIISDQIPCPQLLLNSGNTTVFTAIILISHNHTVTHMKGEKNCFKTKNFNIFSQCCAASPGTVPLKKSSKSTSSWSRHPKFSMDVIFQHLTQLKNHFDHNGEEIHKHTSFWDSSMKVCSDWLPQCCGPRHESWGFNNRFISLMQYSKHSTNKQIM